MQSYQCQKPVFFEQDLALAIGINEAIIIQKIKSWQQLNASKNINYYDGKYWTYNSIASWQKNDFPFFSLNTLKRGIKSLRDKNILIVDNFNKRPGDQTLWYSVNFEEYNKLLGSIMIDNIADNHEESKDPHDCQHEGVGEKNLITRTQDITTTNYQEAMAQVGSDHKAKMSRPLAQVGSDHWPKLGQSLSNISPNISSKNLIISLKDNLKFQRAFEDFLNHDTIEDRKSILWKIIHNAQKYQSTSDDIIDALEISYDKGNAGNLAYFTGILRNKTKNRESGLNPIGRSRYWMIESFVKKQIERFRDIISWWEIDLEKHVLSYSLYDDTTSGVMASHLDRISTEAAIEFAFEIDDYLRPNFIKNSGKVNPESSSFGVLGEACNF